MGGRKMAGVICFFRQTDHAVTPPGWKWTGRVANGAGRPLSSENIAFGGAGGLLDPGLGAWGARGTPCGLRVQTALIIPAVPLRVALCFLYDFLIHRRFPELSVRTAVPE